MLSLEPCRTTPLPGGPPPVADLPGSSLPLPAPDDGGPEQLPSRFGKYEVLEKIGIGGFANVYRGWDPHIKREVAIKTCVSGDREQQALFFREAELAGQLHHVNITIVHEFDLEGDPPYIVQELLSGEDLDRVIARGDSLSLEEKIRILTAIADGLEHAHAAGIIHRDVKPANIRILENRDVKIMDFGIARLVESKVSLIPPGMTVGSAAYLSPEQVKGEKLDCRSDLFSLGVLAYELLSGRKPFAAESIPQLLEKIVLEEPEPLARVIPELPSPLASVVLRALEKKPKDRFQSAAEMKEALASAARPPAGAIQEPEAIPPPLPAAEGSSRQRFWIGLAALLTTAFGALVFFP